MMSDDDYDLSPSERYHYSLDAAPIGTKVSWYLLPHIKGTVAEVGPRSGDTQHYFIKWDHLASGATVTESAIDLVFLV